MITTNYLPVGQIITDAAMELNDEEFRRLTRPFYLAAAQRGMSKMLKEVFGDERYWNTTIPQNGIVQLPKGVNGLKGAWLYNGDACNVSKSTPLFIKKNMHKLGGEGYIANNTWHNHDPLQYSFGVQNEPHHTYFAGYINGELHLSQTCQSFQRIHILYYGTGEDCVGEDFDVPEWMREALIDFVIHRGALRLEREDPQFLARVIDRKQNELKAPNGSWTQAKFIFKRMDPKTRYDTIAMMHRFGHIG